MLLPLLVVYPLLNNVSHNFCTILPTETLNFNKMIDTETKTNITQKQE